MIKLKLSSKCGKRKLAKPHALICKFTMGVETGSGIKWHDVEGVVDTGLNKMAIPFAVKEELGMKTFDGARVRTPDNPVGKVKRCKKCKVKLRFDGVGGINNVEACILESGPILLGRKVILKVWEKLEKSKLKQNEFIRLELHRSKPKLNGNSGGVVLGVWTKEDEKMLAMKSGGQIFSLYSRKRGRHHKDTKS